jgi:thioredoxin reductase
MGIAGQELSNSAFLRTQKFGARIAVARSATGLKTGERPLTVELDDGGSARGQTVIVAAGGRYRRLDAPNHTQFDGVGGNYGATYIEAGFCRGVEVASGWRRQLGGTGGSVSVGAFETCLSSDARLLPCPEHVALSDFPD